MDGELLSVTEAAEWLADMLKWVVAFGGGIIAIRQWVTKPVQALQKQQSDLDENLKRLNQNIGDIQGDVADILADRLEQAYRHFMSRGWCPESEKRKFVDLHKRYRERGHNHLVEHYEKDLLSLPSEPPKEGGQSGEK